MPFKYWIGILFAFLFVSGVHTTRAQDYPEWVTVIATTEYIQVGEDYRLYYGTYELVYNQASLEANKVAFVTSNGEVCVLTVTHDVFPEHICAAGVPEVQTYQLTWLDEGKILIYNKVDNGYAALIWDIASNTTIEKIFEVVVDENTKVDWVEFITETQAIVYTSTEEKMFYSWADVHIHQSTPSIAVVPQQASTWRLYDDPRVLVDGQGPVLAYLRDIDGANDQIVLHRWGQIPFSYTLPEDMADWRMFGMEHEQILGSHFVVMLESRTNTDLVAITIAPLEPLERQVQASTERVVGYSIVHSFDGFLYYGYNVEGEDGCDRRTARINVPPFDSPYALSCGAPMTDFAVISVEAEPEE